MKRYDTTGRDVTDLPGLWSENDCEITTSQYRNPSIKGGQHANGPAQVFIRLCNKPAYPWIPTQMHSQHKVVTLWEEQGIDAFLPF